MKALLAMLHVIKAHISLHSCCFTGAAPKERADSSCSCYMEFDQSQGGENSAPLSSSWWIGWVSCLCKRVIIIPINLMLWLSLFLPRIISKWVETGWKILPFRWPVPFVIPDSELLLFTITEAVRGGTHVLIEKSTCMRSICVLFPSLTIGSNRIHSLLHPESHNHYTLANTGNGILDKMVLEKPMFHHLGCPSEAII